MFSTSKFFRNPPASAPTTDPYFNYTTLLLNDTGTNGAQNNTFVDSSTNNFTITRTGNTTQGSFNPYEPTGYWGGYFDGTGDYFQTAYSTALDLTGNYTIECWYYPVTSVAGALCIQRTTSAPAAPYNFSLATSGGVNYLIFSGSTGGSWDINPTFTRGTKPFNNGTWNHLAVVRNGTTITTYVNGQVDQVFTGVATQTYTTGQGVTIGANDNTGGGAINGYMSNLRIVKGTAVYTAAFTPPTMPLTAITNTSLLCLQDNRFKDNSSNNFTITRTGDVAVTGFNPFAPPASYTTSAYSGSGYFDGTGDYLLVPNNTAFDFGSGNFTVECWFYGTTAYSGVLFSKRANTVSAFGPFQIGFPGSNNVSFLISTSGSSWAIIAISTATAIVGAWNHIALTRNGSSFTLWLNGVSVATGTNSSALYVSTDALSIGAGAADGATPVSAINISNIRIVKGTAVYTAAFTPPTAPLTAISGTSLLLNATNAGIYDATTINNMETVGNAQVSTAQAKWGASSMAFDGTGDVLAIPNNNLLILDAADFTIECWVRFNSKAAYIVVAQKTGQASVSVANWVLQLNAAGTALVFGAGQTSTTGVGSWIGGSWPTVSGTTNLSTGVWYHVAVTKAGTTYRIFINGSLEGTATNANVPSDARKGAVTIGADGNLSGNALNGYIEDLRITKGVARYTANFTPPTAAFPTR